MLFVIIMEIDEKPKKKQKKSKVKEADDYEMLPGQKHETASAVQL